MEIKTKEYSVRLGTLEPGAVFQYKGFTYGILNMPDNRVGFICFDLMKLCVDTFTLDELVAPIKAHLQEE